MSQEIPKVFLVALQDSVPLNPFAPQESHEYTENKSFKLGN